ncbi:MAG TPA: 16S rRNA (cytidine(1402)-2'-O)-methyltransferase [Candidatus Binataceae bacterium]
MKSFSSSSRPGPGILFVVATPIGNSGDLSPRAAKTLAEADLIACEDTRRTGRMLAAHGIRTPTISYFEHVEERRTPELVERLLGGERIAIVTDAGTPAISDPGFRLVRAALEAGISVAAVPGPSAAIAALSIAGIPTNRFAFEGFLPARESARRKMLDALAREPRTMVFFEAARRLADTLAEMAAAFGEGRLAAVVREITKTHEETIRGALAELARRFRTQAALGEVTIVVEGAGGDAAIAPHEATESVTAAMLVEAGMSLKDASAIVARLTGKSRREVYQDALKRRLGATND